jgi:hypothetical protein
VSDISPPLVFEDNSEDQFPDASVEEFETYDVFKDTVLFQELTGDKEDHPSLACHMLTMFDRMQKHKATDISAKSMWNYIKSLLPDDSPVELYPQMKAVLKRHIDTTVQRFDVCVNMCTLFADLKHPKLQHLNDNNSRRTVCKMCGEERYLSSGKPRRIMYYLPIKFWMQSLFNRAELTEHMTNSDDPGTYPKGHLRRSLGWRLKVLDNPNMNDDERNQAFIGQCDGVPFFKDKTGRGGWPFVLSNACLPDNLKNSTGFCHMVGFIANEYYSEDSRGHRFRVQRSFGCFVRVWKKQYDLSTTNSV